MAIKYAPSAPNSSAAMASPMDCSTASAAERVCDWEEGVQCPNDRESDVFHTGNLCFSWRFATPAVSGADASHVLNAQKVGAEAQLDQAKAQKDRADADLQRTELRATVDGRVTKLTAAVGALAAPWQAIMIVVPLDIWVTANFKESQLADMGVGQPVDIRIDAFGGRSLPGEVNSVQAGSGTAFSLLPAENATGNYVKVVQRVPVKITFNQRPDVELGPGMLLGRAPPPRLGTPLDIDLEPDGRGQPDRRDFTDRSTAR
jgi:hypothetical protein